MRSVHRSSLLIHRSSLFLPSFSLGVVCGRAAAGLRPHLAHTFLGMGGDELGLAPLALAALGLSKLGLLSAHGAFRRGALGLMVIGASPGLAGFGDLAFRGDGGATIAVHCLAGLGSLLTVAIVGNRRGLALLRLHATIVNPLSLPFRCDGGPLVPTPGRTGFGLTGFGGMLTLALGGDGWGLDAVFRHAGLGALMVSPFGRDGRPLVACLGLTGLGKAVRDLAAFGLTGFGCLLTLAFGRDGWTVVAILGLAGFSHFVIMALGGESRNVVASFGLAIFGAVLACFMPQQGPYHNMLVMVMVDGALVGTPHHGVSTVVVAHVGEFGFALALAVGVFSGGLAHVSQLILASSFLAGVIGLSLAFIA